eukprot:scaffold474623_cov36-Prasinocladus_malaysianus.AAC.1
MFLMLGGSQGACIICDAATVIVLVLQMDVTTFPPGMVQRRWPCHALHHCGSMLHVWYDHSFGCSCHGIDGSRIIKNGAHQACQKHSNKSWWLNFLEVPEVNPKQFDSHRGRRLTQRTVTQQDKELDKCIVNA